ncbi:MAG: hypothetical protein ACKO5K_00855 [Armatimonadota bacterium]
MSHPSKLFVLALVALTAAGCRPAPTSARLGVPAADRARVYFASIADTADKRHWKWSILAGRNWETPRIEGTTMILEGGYPLNAALRSGGCHTWEVDLKAGRSDSGWSWTLELHGSNGRTARSNGSAAEIDVLETSEKETGLPAELRLARIGGNPVVLRLPR